MNAVIFIDEVDSTNSYATNLLKQYKPAEGTVVITANQTAGKGMMGNTWEFESGKSFAASWIFYPDFLKYNQAFYLYIISSLSVYDFLSDNDINRNNELKIKWPNDILIKNKKISGILTENVIDKEKIKSSVIGIGINMGQTEKFNEFATMNYSCLLTDDDLKKIASELDNKINYYYALLKSKKTDDLTYMYHQRLKDYNQNIKYRDLTENTYKEGINKGIDEFGRLKIQVGNEIKYYSGKELKFIFSTE